MALWVYDFETMVNLCEVTFLAFDTDDCHTFLIDDDTKQNDRKKLIEFVKNQTLVGYNNKTFDDIILNYIIKHDDITANELHKVANKIINGQKEEDFNVYKVFQPYLNNNSYWSIDLMRLLFSKKLRVGLKELECSLQHDNVEELPIAYDKYLTEEDKEKVIAYNINDCKATKLVLQKSIEALQLRRWMKNEYGIDAFSMDGVNGGVKILEVMYAQEIGNRNFYDLRTNREWVHIKDIILPFVKFDTPEFNQVLKVYQNHTWYSAHYDEQLFEDSALSLEPIINQFKFKFSLGGLHGDTKGGIWESNDEYDLISVDVASYYPSMVLKHKFCPEHLNPDIFLRVYQQVKDERMDAKKKGDKLKNETLKLSINGAYGMFGNRYSWLFDHKVRLSICVNGQLMLAMLIEKFFQNDIKLIDANTDGVYVHVHKSKKEKFQEIIKWWEDLTLMEMEQTKFEKMWFVNTADYFGTYLSKGKIEIKEKGMFLSKVALGKGMEFPIISRSIKEYFLNGIPFEETIRNCTDILQFCSYKKLSKDAECWHGQIRTQRTNRYYASKGGAYLFRKSFSEKTQKWVNTHILKDSPVILLNKLDEKQISERNINYGFYTASAREYVHLIEGDRKQIKLF